MRTIILIAFCGLALAEEVKAPEISTEQQLAYRRAQIKILEAQNEMQAVVAGMQKTCGERQVITDSKGDPVCQAKEPTK